MNYERTYGASTPPIRYETGARTDGDVHGMSTKELLSGLLSEGQQLIRSEVKLAGIEVRDELKQAGKNSALIGVGGVVANGAFLVLSFCLVALLATAMRAWVAALIVGAFLAICAGVLIWVGKKRLAEFEPKPKETMREMEEDRRWAKETIRSARSNTRANA